MTKITKTKMEKQSCFHKRSIGQLHLKKGNIPDSKFNKKDLETGIQVETEHTNNRAIAKQIAKAHLVEDKNYYRKLDKAGL